VERGLINLTIRCVDQVQSSTLTAILNRIVEDLEAMVRSRVKRLMVTVGWPLAQRLAHLAASWGNPNALTWALDATFARHLTIVHMNNSGSYGQSSCGVGSQARRHDD
jgi:hypothetical protein